MSDTQQLRIRKWNPATMNINSTVVLIGKRGSGKTSVLKAICHALYQTGKIDLVLAFSATEDSTSALSGIVPPSLIHDVVNPTVIDNVMAVQKRQWKRPQGGKQVLMLLDDVAFDTKMLRSKSIRQLFLNGRHHHICVILSLQYALLLGPCIRGNCDVVVACRENVVSSRRKLYEQFFGFFPTFKAFTRAFGALTNNYETMVLNNCQSNSLEDSIFWYKADIDALPREFPIGRSEVWQLDDQYFTENGRAATPVVHTLDIVRLKSNDPDASEISE